ncbi:LemA family protein [Brucella endophytica]|uniref:LemA family protein n=1 Tax=Brucella endophytica TaxID=1963359 RepID=A0A916WHZ1_9HYPH|nr:LemA family protein [Brucella endophytica]GGB03064.1 LemA family protein [Brucella endophytica]
MIADTISRPAGRRLLPVLLLALLAPLLSACGFNVIPTQEEQVKAAWSQVLNQYQRRADLIPNLVATVQGYATHEQKTFTDVVEARAKATQATIQLPPDALSNPELFKQFEQNQANLTGALGRLMAVAENYPDLKANQNFLALQSQLEGTENRIAVARRDYIEAVRVYNTSLQTLPTMLWRLIWFRDKKPLPTFTISEQAQQAPKVQFNN